MGRHWLVYLHGIAPSPGPEEASCTRIIQAFHDALTRRLHRSGPRGRAVAERLAPIVIHWGHVTAHRGTPDTALSTAEAFLSAMTDADRRRQRVDRGAIPAATWLIRRRLARPLRQMLVEGLGDLVYYTAPEGERAIRTTLYRQLFNAWPFRQDTLSAEPMTLSVVAHSAGAVLAFDLLYELFCPTTRRQGRRAPAIAHDDRRWGRIAKRLRSARERVRRGTLTLQTVATLGSFLPIFFLRRQHLVDRLAGRRRLTADIIGLRGQGRWVNVWDYDDLVAFPIAGLFRDPEHRIQDLQVDTGDWMASAHAGYWRHPEVLDAVAGALARSKA